MTSASDNGATVRALIKAAYDRDYEKAASFASPDIEVIDEPTGRRYVGHDGLRQFVEYWLDTFRHYQHDITNLVADDDGVAIEYVFQEWHDTEPTGPIDEGPKATRYVPSRSAAFFKMTDGKVAGYHLYYNPPESFP
jgi:predicted ester cyclase